MVALTSADSGRQDVDMGAGAQKVRPPTFSYSGVARGPKYEAWREEFCRRFCQLDAYEDDAERIECTVEIAQLGNLSFGLAYGASGGFVRTKSLLADGCEDLVLIAAARGDVLTVQHGHTAELKQSQMSLLAIDEIGQSRFGLDGAYRSLRIPRRDLLSIAPGAEDRLSMPLLASPRLRSVINSYFSLCMDTGLSLDAVSQHTMARHMTELVAMLLQAETDEKLPESGSTYGETRLQLIKAEALKHLGDDRLSIASVAKQAGLTPKQVQRLFGTAGLTFSEFVLENRLLLAHRLLSRESGGMEKISAIAQDAGFGDLSYFNRSFRRRFGMTPSEWRDAQLARH